MSVEARMSSKPKKFCTEYKYPSSDKIKIFYKLIGQKGLNYRILIGSLILTMRFLV